MPCWGISVEARPCSGGGVFSVVEENRLPAPVIPSKWFAERVATVERVRVLNARTFGSSMLQRLDACASRLLDQHLEFFQQPESAGNRTTRERWLFKNHEAFVIGLEPANVRMLRSLARFRELVGEFPTSVPYSNHPFTSQQEAAFEYAWRSHRGKEGAVYSLAFHAYQKITRGEFVDQDTAIVRMRSFDGDGVSGY